MSTPPDTGIYNHKGHITVSLHGPVDDNMYAKVLHAIHLIPEPKSMTFILNTEGGYVSHGFAIYDLISSSAVNAKIICAGEVMSAGILILMAGDERVTYPNTQFMIHFGLETNQSTDEVLHNSRLTKRMKDILYTNCDVTKKTINGWFTKETYFDAERAVSAGLIDRITK